MFVYEPGSGFSGVSVKVEPGFEMSEISNFTQEVFSTVNSVTSMSDSFSMSEMSSVVSSISTQIIEPTPIKR